MRVLNKICVCAIGLIVVACGSSDQSQNRILKTGQLIDSPVSGLLYASQGASNLRGITGGFGEFSYLPDGATEFLIGGISLGTARNRPIVSVLELQGGDPAAAINLTRFLLTLDQDLTASNGIQISAALASLADSKSIPSSAFAEADFENSELSTFARAAYESLGATSRQLVALSVATEHFNCTQSDIADGRYDGDCGETSNPPQPGTATPPSATEPPDSADSDDDSDAGNDEQDDSATDDGMDTGNGSQDDSAGDGNGDDSSADDGAANNGDDDAGSGNDSDDDGATGEPDIRSLSDVDFELIGFGPDEQNHGYGGRSFVSFERGDINGDGIDDLVSYDKAFDATAGSPQGTGARESNEGRLLVMFGREDLQDLGAMNAEAIDGSNGFIIVGQHSRFPPMDPDQVSFGDFNGDGIDDLAIGETDQITYRQNYCETCGVLTVIYGGANIGESGSIDLSSIDGSNGFSLKSGVAGGSDVPRSIDLTGDINGDGFADLIYSESLQRVGLLHRFLVVFGAAEGFDSGLIPFDDLPADRRLAISNESPPAPYDPNRKGFQMSSFAGTDINADGFDDLFLKPASWYEDDEEVWHDLAVILYGAAALSDHDEIDVFNSTAVDKTYVHASQSVRTVGIKPIAGNAGDINGDGIDDAMFSAGSLRYCGDNIRGSGIVAGANFVVFGREGLQETAQIDLLDIDGSNGFGIFAGHGQVDFHLSETNGSRANGDVNGDGFADIVLQRGGPRQVVSVLYGESSPTAYVDMYPHDDRAGFYYDEPATNQVPVATDVEIGSDVNGDGISDLLLGIRPAAGTPNLSNAMAVVLGGKTEFTTRLSRYRPAECSGVDFHIPAAPEDDDSNGGGDGGSDDGNGTGGGGDDGSSNDQDGDGINDDVDNCPSTSNPLQTNSDDDQLGDACDGDDDNDGVDDELDNCQSVANGQQSNLDQDALGDACDADDDGDGVDDAADNCPMKVNDQRDSDGDGVGDACDDNTVTHCDVENGLLPLVQPFTLVGERVDQSCLSCSVSDKEHVVDFDPDNFATLQTMIDVLGGVQLTVSDTEHDYPVGSRAGFVVAHPLDLLSVELLGGVTLTSYLNGIEQESADLQELVSVDLLSLLGDDQRYFAGFTATKAFDGLGISFGGVAHLLPSLNVYGACVSSIE